MAGFDFFRVAIKFAIVVCAIDMLWKLYCRKCCCCGGVGPKNLSRPRTYKNLFQIAEAAKLNRKESYKAQRKNYRKEKKRVASELLNSLQDPGVIVLADWLKVRGTLKSWTKLWCCLKVSLGTLFLVEMKLSMFFNDVARADADLQESQAEEQPLGGHSLAHIVPGHRATQQKGRFLLQTVPHLGPDHLGAAGTR
jgi:hypothetical protein